MTRDVVPMSLDLATALNDETADAGFTARPLNAHDAPRLGEVMVSAYRGTIDDRGETITDATIEIVQTFAGTHGTFNWAASFSVEVNGELVGACLVTSWRERPLVAYVFTLPEQQRAGIATHLFRASMAALKAQGATELTLAVTRGSPAINLYTRLGFREFA